MTTCKGLIDVECNKLEDCVYTAGMKRQYCRRKRNTRKTSKTRKMIKSSKRPKEYGPVRGCHFTKLKCF